MNDWIKDYILLAFKIDRWSRKVYHAPYIDYYLKTEEIIELSRVDKDDSPKDAVRQAMRLFDLLPVQGFDQIRTAYLGKQTKAMETMARILCNEDMSYDELVKNCLDINPIKIPDEHYEKGLELFNQALPGTGSINDRFYLWLQRNDVSYKADKQILEIIKTVLDELKQRSKRLFQLPEDNVEIEIVDDRTWGAANWYLGNYSSLLQINKGKTISLFNLLPILCHEIYPGHHSEFSMKEYFLLNKHSYHEQSIYIVNSPQLVISEGIADTAFEVLFTFDEAAEWMIEGIYKKLNIKVNDVDLPILYQALTMNNIDQLSGNVVDMINEGHPEDDICKYMMKYSLQPEYKIREIVNLYRNSLFWQIYNISYANGKHLISNFIKGNKETGFLHVLQEQVFPSLIINQ